MMRYSRYLLFLVIFVGLHCLSTHAAKKQEINELVEGIGALNFVDQVPEEDDEELECSGENSDGDSDEYRGDEDEKKVQRVSESLQGYEIETLLLEECQKQIRRVKDFSKISINLPDEVEVFCSIKRCAFGDHGVIVGSPDFNDDLNSIITHVWKEDASLRVAWGRFRKKKLKRVYLSIQIPCLNYVLISGSVKCVIQGIRADGFKLECTGESFVKIVNVESPFMEVEASGRSEVTLSDICVEDRSEIRGFEKSNILCKRLREGAELGVESFDDARIALTDIGSFKVVLASAGKSFMSCFGFSQAVKIRIVVQDDSQMQCCKIGELRKLLIECAGKATLLCCDFKVLVSLKALLRDKVMVYLRGQAKNEDEGIKKDGDDFVFMSEISGIDD